jgi:hypothetical protein
MNNSLLRMQHSSLQYSDPARQQRTDIRDLFKLGENFPIKTGTEAGRDAAGLNQNREFLQKSAEEYDHVLHISVANWIAVDRRIIKKGTLERDAIFIIDNDKLVGKMHNRTMPTLSWTHVDPTIGELSVGAAHYATRGAVRGDPNYQANLLYANKIANWMVNAGRGRKKVFVNGDFNMNDRHLDWAFGRNFTSMADELKAWENTGHGPIDGFCSYDKDQLVKAQRFNVLSDKEFPQFSDHKVIRGVWEVLDRPGKGA